jgi:hypothetical protein
MQYSNFEKKIQNNELFIKMYDVDPFHVLYVLKIPEHLFDVKYKEQILTFHNAPRTSDLYGILWKTRQFREKLETKLTGIVERESDIIKIDPAAELHDPPLLEEEMYLEKYKIKKIIKPNVEYE